MSTVKACTRQSLDFGGAGLTAEDTGKGEHITPNAQFVIQIAEWAGGTFSKEHTACEQSPSQETEKGFLESCEHIASACNVHQTQRKVEKQQNLGICQSSWKATNLQTKGFVIQITSLGKMHRRD